MTKCYALATFQDTEGAFDRTIEDIFEKLMSRKRFSDGISQCNTGERPVRKELPTSTLIMWYPAVDELL